MNDNNELNTNKSEEGLSTVEDCLAVINKLKNDTISKESFNKLKEENRQLLNNIVNNNYPQEQNTEKEKVDVNALRVDIFKKELPSLDYTEKCLKLRQALMDQGKPDPLLPIGRNIAPEESSVKDAQNVADLLQDCVDYADGDNAIFIDSLQRRMVDLPMSSYRRK